MSTRITQNMMNQTLMYNLQTNYSKLNKIQQQLASQKKYNMPSDNPVAAVRAMYYKSTLNEINQYRSNAGAASSWLQATDDALDQVTDILHRVNELTINAGNETNSPLSLQAIADEIRQLSKQLAEVANSDIGGRYIFSGTATQTAPVDVTKDPPEVIDNTDSIEYRIGKSSTIKINVSGDEVFNQNALKYGGTGMFQLLKNITDKIDLGISPADQLGDIEAQIDNVLKTRSDIGARMNQMDLITNRLDGLELSTSTLLSLEVDVDVAQAFTDLSEQQSVYTAALSVGAKIIQPTLVDFLR